MVAVTGVGVGVGSGADATVAVPSTATVPLRRRPRDPGGPQGDGGRVLTVGATTSQRSVADLVDAARGQPGKLNDGSSPRPTRT